MPHEKEISRYINYKEECELSIAERIEYLTGLKEHLKSRKLTNTTCGATLWGPKLYGITQKIAKKVTSIFTDKDCEVVIEGQDNIPNETVLFAFNHQGILDGFAWIPYSKRHTIILHGGDVNKLLIAAQINTGLVKVIKGDRKNNQGAKLDAISLLLNNHSIAWFPESTWNLSPNKILLPLNYGFIDVARIAQVPIVPVALENTYSLKNDKCIISKVHIRFGEVISVGQLDNLSDVLEIYKERISTMLYEIVEKKGIYERQAIDVDKEYAKFLEMSFKNLKLGKLNWVKEKQYIHSANDEFYSFYNINEYEYDENYCEKGLAESVKYYRKMRRKNK